MANGQQQPRTDFPGAEYFALVPNANIALGPRLSIQSPTSPTQTTPASAIGSFTVDAIVDPNFTVSSAIWVVRSYAVFQPIDQTGKLQITAARMGVGPPPLGNIFLDVGTPLATFATPNVTQIIISDRDFLVTGLDLGTAFPLNGPLHIYHQVSVVNLDTTASHTYSLGAITILHKVSGFVQ